MGSLAELILNLCDLLEAEGRLLRANVLRATQKGVLLVLGLLFGAAGLAFFVAAIYKALAMLVPEPVALAILGFLCLAIGIIIWSASQWPKTRKQQQSRSARKKN